MAKFFIDRPVFAWVIALFILLAGALSTPRLTRVRALLTRSFLNTSRTEPLAPRFAATLLKTTDLPSPEIIASQLSPLPCAPADVLLTSLTCPRVWSSTKTSFLPLVSVVPGILLAAEQKAM